jgi:hypothetical protein
MVQQQVTGNSIKRSDTFDINHIERYEGSILLRRDGFSFYMSENGEFRSVQDVSEFDFTVIPSEIKNLTIWSDTNRVVAVPNVVEPHSEAFYSHHEHEVSRSIITVKKPSFSLLYDEHTVAIELLQQLPMPKSFHHLIDLIKDDEEKDNIAAVHFGETMFLKTFSQNQLQGLTSFKVKSQEDVLYFVGTMLEEKELDEKLVSVQVVSDLKCNEFLAEYFTNLKIQTTESSLLAHTTLLALS